MSLDHQPPTSPLHTPTSSPSAPYPQQQHVHQPQHAQFNPFWTTTASSAGGSGGIDGSGTGVYGGLNSVMSTPGGPSPLIGSGSAAAVAASPMPSSSHHPPAPPPPPPGPSASCPPTTNTTPSHQQTVDLGLGLRQGGLAGESPMSSIAPSRQPSSSGGGGAGSGLTPAGGTGGTFTPDLSARINAMSLESKIRDIEGCVPATSLFPDELWSLVAT